MTESFGGGELPPGLLEDYLRTARAQLEFLDSLAARIADHPEDADTLTEFRRETHKMRGSAGSYGFAEATRVAGEAEDAAKAWLADPATGRAARGRSASDHVTRLRAAFGTALDRLPPAPTAAAAVTAAGPAAQVYLVEDDAALIELFEYGFRSRGYRFHVFTNGREALATLRSVPLGGASPLLILDVDLPALDGYAIFDALRYERPGAFRTVFMTVHGNEDEQVRALQSGAVDYLVKPINLRVALEKIARWVGR